MKLFNHKNLLLLIGAQLLISIILVEAGLFDQFKKKQNDKNKEKTKNDNKEVQQNDATPEVKSNIPQRLNKKLVTKKEESADLVAELAKMDEAKLPIRPKGQKRFSNMLAAAKEKSRLEDNASQEEEDSEQEAEEVDEQPQTPIRSPSTGGGIKIRRPNAGKPTSIRTPSSSSGLPGLGRFTNGHNKNKDDSKTSKSLFSSAFNSLADNKIMHAHYWKKEMKDAYHITKEKVKELPTVMKDASDSVSALLKLDSRGRLLAMIKEVDEDISFVAGEFSTFSITWSSIMEKSLNYIGLNNLNKLQYKEKDELDFRKDALITATFGYEFMNLMMAWRENLMIAHLAYKDYLLKVLQNLEKEKFEVKEEFIYQLETIHNYILLNSWMQIDDLSTESKMKLDYLMDLNDRKPKNYESEYFRQMIVLQEIYDPTSQEFKEEREQVIEALGESGQTDDSFNDIDEFYQQFRDHLVQQKESGIEITNALTVVGDTKKKIDWEVTDELVEFMNKLQPELKYNQIIYQKSFLRDLKEAKEKAMNELYGQSE